MDYISREELYEKTAEWEAQALHMVERAMHDEDEADWKKWSVILKERSAFKFDVADMPAADVKPVVHGKWLLKDRDGSWACWTCSECGRLVHLTDYKENVQEEYPFCHCGADMRGNDNG